jgi:hypothetical protein
MLRSSQVWPSEKNKEEIPALCLAKSNLKLLPNAQPSLPLKLFMPTFTPKLGKSRLDRFYTFVGQLSLHLLFGSVQLGNWGKK